MTQRRSNIPILGGIFFLIIIIGSALNGKPGMLISILATVLIMLCIYFLRNKTHDKKEIAHLTDEVQFMTTQQQSHIQLFAIFIPLILITAAIHGDLLVLITIIAILSIVFTGLSLKKRSVEQEKIYSFEKKILFRSVVFGLICSALIFYFDLAK